MHGLQAIQAQQPQSQTMRVTHVLLMAASHVAP